MPGPLSGYTVLDFTRYQQGPYATTLLADFGARVLKVEEPGSGDFGRRLWRGEDGYSPFWEALNRGKESICIDLRDPEGAALALELGAHCDVVAENFRSGVMDRWGLGYDAFRARNPQIIYAQASGWGAKGPLAFAPSFDQIAQARSGFAQHAGGGPGETPIVPYPGLADHVGAMNFFSGILAALLARERTGQGQRLEVSLLGTQMALQTAELQHAFHAGSQRPREFRSTPTAGHYLCGDGRWIMVVGIDQKFWPRLCQALGLDELRDDPRFARGGARFRHRDELQAALEARFLERPAAEWARRLAGVDHPAEVIQGHEEIANDPQVLANEYVVERDHPRWGREKTVGLHIQLSGTPGAVSAPAPELGEHTLSVLREFGTDEARIEKLLAKGVIATG
jgi:crotonobetainyl-CoA:carnitine CoA-transferase CaiB-like acyl-CoA transferase